MPAPLLKSGRRYRVLQDVGDLKAGREVELLLAEYSYLPHNDTGGWWLMFADAALPLEQTDQAFVIERIHDYFQDLGPFDWQSRAGEYARIIRERSGVPDSEDPAQAESLAAALDRELEAVLRAQPASPDPMSPKKAYQLAAKRLRAKGVAIG